MPAAAGVPCLLINPLSCRALYGALTHKARALAEAQGLRVEVTGDPSRVLELLAQWRAERLQRLFVMSGDGTLQLIASYLAELPDGDWDPELLFLGGGRANVVPRAFGGTPALPALRRVLAALRDNRPLRMERQPLLCVSQPGRPVRRGFVLAGALIDFGVRHCRQWRSSGTSWWHRGLLADQICLLRLVLQVVFGRSPVPDMPQMRVQMQPGGTLYAPMRVLVAGTLQAGGHYNPYARRGEGPLRLTAVAAEAPHFWRNLPRMISGRFDDGTMGVAQGYLSGQCHTARIMGMSSYSLDGEPFDVDPTQEVLISAERPLKVLYA